MIVQNKIAVGIDIGGTNTVLGLVDQHGNILFRDLVKTTDFPDPQNFISVISERIKSLLNSGDLQLEGIGIGAPNGNYFNGTIEFAPNLKWKGIVPLVNLFKEHFDVPVFLTNDANAAAMGEKIYGGAKEMKDFIFITLGTGVGSGIVANGHLVYGHDGFAGEIGHVIVDFNGRPCGCGRKGCLETYCSAGGIVTTMNELIQQEGIEGKEWTSKSIYEAAMKGDTLAIHTFEITGEILGKALANSVAYTSPEAIFLFGGLAQAGELIFEPTKQFLEDNLLEIYKGKVKLLSSSLPEADAAILGASALVW